LGTVTLEELNFTEEFSPKYQAVKEAVLPFKRFPGSDTLLGPEMRSTGEVMGLAKDFGIAYAKSELAAGNGVPSEGVAFLSTNDLDKKNLEEVARELLILGFKLIATKGTASYLLNLGIQVEEVLKVHEGRPNIEDLIRSGLVQLIINTPIGSQALHDDAYLRRVLWNIIFQLLQLSLEQRQLLKQSKLCNVIKSMLTLCKKSIIIKILL